MFTTLNSIVKILATSILGFLLIVCVAMAETEQGQGDISPISADSSLSDSTNDTTVGENSSPRMLAGIIDTTIIIPRLDFSGMSLVNALTALSRAYNLSIYVDSSVIGSVNIRLDNVSLEDALSFLIQENGLIWRRTGDIIKITKPAIPPAPPPPLDITLQDGLLSMSLQNAPIGRLIDTLVDISGRNIIPEQNLNGYVTGKVTSLPLDRALEALLPANGFTVRTVDGIAYIGTAQNVAEPGGATRNLWVQCNDGLVSVNIEQGALAQVIATIGRQCDASVIVQTQLQGTISASFKDRTLEDALTSLLINSAYTFTLLDGIYYIGDRKSQDMYDTKLVCLKHLIANAVAPLIPVSLSEQVTVKVVPEHNGLVITGPRTSIARIESFIREVDIPTAQVLFEVLVVDYQTSDRAEFGIEANNTGAEEGLPGETYFPSIDLSADGEEVNRGLASLERHLKIGNLGRVGSDFYVRLNMMQQQGIANVRSHPQIASLNGHEASIQIGTSQYYLLESTTVHPSQETSLTTQTSQRFEVIKADMSLQVTPYVSPDGELTVEVKPEFSTPVGSFDSKTPPTINSRVLESTVRLRSGETIVLGGLVQTIDEETIDKFPILGSIPLIGRIFQNRSKNQVKSEFVIYITPYVYFGSEGAVNIDSLMNQK